MTPVPDIWPGTVAGLAAPGVPGYAGREVLRDAARELDAWQAAVGHLHAAGLPAAVPSLAAAWLRRLGVRADWETAA